MLRNPGYIPMKKLSVVLLFLGILFESATSHCQDSTSAKNRISIGYGWGYVDPIVRNFNLDTYNSSHQIVGPFYFKWERLMTRSLAFGISGSYVQLNAISNPYYNSVPFTVHGYNLHMRVNFYIPTKVKWMEPYCGFGFGIRDYYQKSSDPYQWHGGNDDIEYQTGGEISAGSRFYLLEWLAIYAELGLSKTYFQAGLSGKF